LPAVSAALVFAHSPAVALTLAQAEQELARRNPDIAIAHTSIEGATANVTVAGQHPNPTLSLQTTQISPINGIGPGRAYDKTVDSVVAVSLPIERGDKAKLRREAALDQLAGARHDFAETRRQQRLALHQAYYDLKLAEERLANARETRDIADQALAVADRRVRAGDLAAIDRIRLQVDALRTANDVTTAQNDVRQARIALAAVMGMYRAMALEGTRGPVILAPSEIDELTASDPWPPVNDASAFADPAAALAELSWRADVAAADARVAAANAGRAVARSLRTRDVTVGAQLERAPASNSGVTFGVTVSLPLFVRYGYEGEIAKAEADYSTAMLTRTKVRTQAEAEIEKAGAALLSARTRLTNFEAEIVIAARRALDAIGFAYARGAAPLTDLLDARRTWRTTQGDLAQARADHAKALSAWRAATEWERASEDRASAR
jgi:cobalt-zinc-cadmium efflux system outer membrane protein